MKRLLTRALMAAALIGGTGAVLSAGSAEAATGCGEKISWVAWVGGQDLTCGDKVFSWESTAVLGNLGSSVVSAVQPNPGDYLFNLDFPDFTTNPFDFNYIGLAEFRVRGFRARQGRISRPAHPASRDHSITPKS